MINISPTILKYVVSGLIASGVMFCSLMFFREILGVWYLYSSTLAFIFAFLTSFLLQKFWTFGHSSELSTSSQLVAFFLVSLANLGLNGLGMFILVDWVGLWYLLSQMIVTALIALWSFFVYRAIFLGSTGGFYQS